MNTRALHGLIASRIAGEDIALEYSTYVDSGDGSAVVTPYIFLLKGSVGALQPHDIERLEKAGIIVKNGVTIVIKECPEEQPDKITHAGKNYRVLNWSYNFDYVLGSGNYGTVIATCDEMTIQGATYSPSGSI